MLIFFDALDTGARFLFSGGDTVNSDTLDFSLHDFFTSQPGWPSFMRKV
jgi:hypothetical protein